MTVKIIIKRQKVAECIREALDKLSKTQKQVADEMNLKNPNLITMWKQDKARVPLNRLLSLANALEIDAWFFVRLALLEYYPQLYQIIEKVSPSLILTQNEINMIKSFRQVTDYSNPEFRFNSSETRIIAGFRVAK